MPTPFSDRAFVPIPRRRTPSRTTRAPRIGPRTLEQARKEGIGGLKGRPRFNPATFIQRSREASSEQKAIWHNEMGAGRSRVKREFFGLSPDQQETVKTRVAEYLSERIKAAGA